ncbi:MAG: tartrate-resistant acid phosphatase type 5 [Thermoanaerobaculia bacterium]|jgi:3',5'-cyclic AMP phosphodiesterase CpdA|nr:tartrate-resistant acid phosphatase type 5 [Thermoanaerobaculia bacterium]
MITTVYLLIAALGLGAAPIPHVALHARGNVLRIAVVGDTGEGSDRVARGIARLHAASPLDAVIITGDAFYPCGPASKRDPQWSRARALSRIGIPLFPVLGNHDYCGKSSLDAQIGAPAVPHWQFPARQYVIDAKVAELLMLDTTPYANGRNDDAADAVRDAFASKKAVWRIAAGHHPIISSGYHGHFPRAQHLRMITIEPAMKRAGVDLYICGHDHHLELIDGNPRFLISGAGSDPVPPLIPHAKTLFPSEARAQLGFAVLELDDHTMTIRFYDGEGVAISKRFAFRR